MKTIEDLFKKYFLNCFILMLPILLWNILLSSQLPENYQPEVFSRGIPIALMYVENSSRFFLFVIACLMPLNFHTKEQKVGLYVYLSGLLLYFASWIIIICFPKSDWSNSIIGFSAPAYTPIIWIAGIALIGDSFSFSIPYRPWIFITVSAVFLAAHISHAIMVFYTLN